MSEKSDDNSEPDFSDFADWYGPNIGITIWEYMEDLSTQQKQIVENNVALLLDKEKWKTRVDAFEDELSKIVDENERQEKRAEFAIHFDRYEFNSGRLELFNYYFPCNVSFDNVKFADHDVGFSEAKFSSSAHFTEAEFGEGYVNFQDAEFGKGNVWFTGAIFQRQLISFSRATFEGELIFTPNKEKSTLYHASFNDVVISGNFIINADYNCDETIFYDLGDDATFQRLNVKGSANFSGSTFKQVPDFRDAIFDRPPEVANMKVQPPKMEGFLCKDKNDASKYRKLKSMAVAASDHVKSGEFFAYEMMAKRGMEIKKCPELTLNYLYGLFSGYGQSYKRPLASLGIIWASFTFLNMLIVFRTLDFLDGSFFAARLSLHNLVPFISSLARFVPSPDKYVSNFQTTMNGLESDGVNIGALTLFGVSQQLIGAILLFLLLLGLRNKFRLK